LNEKIYSEEIEETLENYRVEVMVMTRILVDNGDAKKKIPRADRGSGLGLANGAPPKIGVMAVPCVRVSNESN
jgi:hypothetical protein